MTLFGPPYCSVEHRLSLSHTTCTERHASGVERLHGCSEALALLANDILRRHVRVVEDHLARQGPMEAHFLVDLSNTNPILSGVDGECRDALRSLFPLGYCEHAQHVSDGTVRDPHLRSVQPVTTC